MTTRAVLSLAAAISLFVLSGTTAIADQTAPPTVTIKKPHGEFDFMRLPNDFFTDGTQALLQDNFKAVSSQFSSNLPRAQELGFGTDPTSARIPPRALPFLLFHVGLKDLQDFSPSKEISDLLTFTNQVLLPVEVDGKITSSVTFRFLGNQVKTGQRDKETGWRVTRWGRPKLIRQLTERLPPGTLGILVSIPALNRTFGGYVEGADLKLVPLVSPHPANDKTPVSAKEVLLGLVHEAKSVDGSPR
ncbi:MAG TPA: hypothetical protein PKD12_01195 [Nitrospira sp.]|nr:hypothetical protein [Nitrospira sp.]